MPRPRPSATSKQLLPENVAKLRAQRERAAAKSYARTRTAAEVDPVATTRMVLVHILTAINAVHTAMESQQATHSAWKTAAERAGMGSADPSPALEQRKEELTRDHATLEELLGKLLHYRDLVREHGPAGILCPPLDVTLGLTDGRVGLVLLNQLPNLQAAAPQAAAPLSTLPPHSPTTSVVFQHPRDNELD